MGSTVVQSEAMEALRQGLREGIDEELTHLGIQIRPLQKEPVTRGGLHRAIDIEPLEDMLAGGWSGGRSGVHLG
jgi:hypothetical protein